MGGSTEGSARRDAETLNHYRHRSLLAYLPKCPMAMGSTRNRDSDCEGADRKVEWALWTHNPTQVMAVFTKLESSPVHPSKPVHTPLRFASQVDLIGGGVDREHARYAISRNGTNPFNTQSSSMGVKLCEGMQARVATCPPIKST